MILSVRGVIGDSGWPESALQDDRGRTRVSRADFAVALIDEAEQAMHVREQISVAY